MYTSNLIGILLKQFFARINTNIIPDGFSWEGNLIYLFKFNNGNTRALL